jgi:hypothetical protein
MNSLGYFRDAANHDPLLSMSGPVTYGLPVTLGLSGRYRPIGE